MNKGLERKHPQLYVAVYLNPGTFKRYYDQYFIQVKLGSTTDSIFDRVRSEGGQMSFSNVLELLGFWREEKMSSRSLIAQEEEWRDLVRQRWENKYGVGGYISKENFYIPLNSIEEFLGICEESLEELMTYVLKQPPYTKIINFTDNRRQFLFEGIPFIKSTFNSAIEVFNTISRLEGLEYISLLNEFIKRRMPKKEAIYEKRERKKSRTEDETDQHEFEMIHPVDTQEIKRLRTKASIRRGSDNLIALLDQTSYDRKVERRQGKNFKWPFSIFSRKVGDIIYFKDSKNPDIVIPCMICDKDYILPLVGDYKEPLPKATFIHEVAGKYHYRNTEKRTPTYDWMIYFFLDSEAKISFKEIAISIRMKKLEELAYSLA